MYLFAKNLPILLLWIVLIEELTEWILSIEIVNLSLWILTLLLIILTVILSIILFISCCCNRGRYGRWSHCCLKMINLTRF
jgi:hypothetical protein